MDPRQIPVRQSNLKRMARSPLHYLDGLTTDHETRPMRVGFAVDARVFGATSVVVYDGERRGNAWKTFQAENDGRRIITRPEDADAEPIAAAIKKGTSPQAVMARKLLAGQHQVEIDWKYLGRDCQSHLDVLADRHIADLKVTNDVDPGRFVRHAQRMGWVAQGAFYRMAARARGHVVDDVYIVAVENKRPYDVLNVRITPEALAEADKQIRGWMERLLGCEATGEWPGQSQDVVDLLPFQGDEEVSLLIDGEEIAA
jgi:hypothetical protein